MSNPLVTEVSDPSVAILFNEKSGPGQVADILNRQHAFVEYEVYDTHDEQGRPAWLLLVYIETATPNEVMAMIGSRLPDYIQARMYPPSLIEKVRREAAPG